MRGCDNRTDNSKAMKTPLHCYTAPSMCASLATIALLATLHATAQTTDAAPVRSYDPLVLTGEQDMTIPSGGNTARELELRLPKSLGNAAVETYVYAEVYNTKKGGPQYGVYQVITNDLGGGMVQVGIAAGVLVGQTASDDVIRCRYTVVQRLKQFPCGEANFPPCVEPKGQPPVRMVRDGQLVFGAGAADMKASADQQERSVTIALPPVHKGARVRAVAWSTKSAGNSLYIVRARLQRTRTGAALTITARWNGSALDWPVRCNYVVECERPCK